VSVAITPPGHGRGASAANGPSCRSWHAPGDGSTAPARQHHRPVADQLLGPSRPSVRPVGRIRSASDAAVSGPSVPEPGVPAARPERPGRLGGPPGAWSPRSAPARTSTYSATQRGHDRSCSSGMTSTTCRSPMSPPRGRQVQGAVRLRIGQLSSSRLRPPRPSARCRTRAARRVQQGGDPYASPYARRWRTPALLAHPHWCRSVPFGGPGAPKHRGRLAPLGRSGPAGPQGCASRD
jgi:hypothetical protein